MTDPVLMGLEREKAKKTREKASEEMRETDKSRERDKDKEQESETEWESAIKGMNLRSLEKAKGRREE